MSPKMQEFMKHEVLQLFKEDIEPSHSPWNLPIVMIKKLTGKY